MFSLADLLDLPLLRSARPEILAGTGFAQRPVRWVHTSEIFDISPLLKGGEVLFTTGLGLVGADDVAIDQYIESLAAQEVTALVMEVGRTFVRLPAQFEASASAHDLPLIILRRMVPFVEITETVHPLLITREVTELRQREEAFRELTSGMLAGEGLSSLVRLVGQIGSAPVGLYSPGGQLLHGDDVRSMGAPSTELPVGPEPWALLAVAAQEGEMAVEVARVGARVVALRLAQDMTGSPSRTLAISDLLADVASGRFLQSAEVEARAALLGFAVNPGRPLVAMAVDLTQAARSGLRAVTSVVRRQFGSNFVSEYDGRILIIVHLQREQSLRGQMSALAEGIERELGALGHGHIVRLVAGPEVERFSELSQSIPRSVEGVRLARSLGLLGPVITDRDLGLYSLLAHSVPDTALEHFVDQQLGPLLQADARSGNRLMETLSAYLESGRSKSAAAKGLNLSRQAMYQRLERISALLGDVDLSAQDPLVSLDLAVMAWRIRTSGLGRRYDA